MQVVMYVLGEFVIEHQRGVKNIQKEVEHLPNDNDFARQQRIAKTILDEKVQERLLQVAAECFDPSKIYLDAEEETAMQNVFSSTPKPLVLVIDPIDGTLRYLLGEDGFSICVGLIENGAITASLVYFPSRKEFYFIKNGYVYCKQGNKLLKLSAPKEKDDLSIYMNSRVVGRVVSNLYRQGFKLTSDTDGLVSWPDALIKCIKGEYGACIFHTPQVRDILLGTMISKMAGGYACDWQGDPIIWPSGGRIPRIVFGFNPKSLDMFSCLQDI